MTVKQLIELLQTMPPRDTVAGKDRYGCRYWVDDVLVFGYDDDGDPVRNDDPRCVNRDVTIMLRDV